MASERELMSTACVHVSVEICFATVCCRSCVQKRECVPLCTVSRTGFMFCAKEKKRGTM